MNQENLLVRQTLSLLHVRDVLCGKERVGGRHDGGYVMANQPAGCAVAYSIGVGPQVEWDVEMAKRGTVIHQYDHTVEKSPSSHANFFFYKLGIAPGDGQPDLITLPEMLRRNGDVQRTGMILKMDVEGAEWDVFNALSSDVLLQFDQIVVEFHGLGKLSDPGFRNAAASAWSKLAKTHQPVHVHGNNWSTYCLVHGVPLPDVIEMTYCHREKFEFSACDGLFPTELDDPCHPQQTDYFLGNFRFT